ncbi:MAG: hypothetical protein QG580_79 [Patescibacteria group bacterium]|nr:hypothetical protein [Patescibacteria group bacterium]
MLEKCGILFIAYSVGENLPTPRTLNKIIGELEAVSGLTSEEIRQVYRYVQEEAFKMYLPKERRGVGFK